MHKLETFLAKPGKLHLKGLVHLLSYIRGNRTLGLKYYADMNDAPLSDLLKQDSINTDNQMMDYSDSSWQYFPDTVRSTGSYIIFYQAGLLDQSSVESDYNAACTAGMTLAHLRMLINELLRKDPDVFPEEGLLIILGSKSDVCMAENANDNNNTRHISRTVNLVSNE